MPGEPVRLRLSRAKGFDLQALSMATNGLPAVSVARPHRWGNSWKVGSQRYDSARNDFRECETIEDAIQAFRQSVEWNPNSKSILPTDYGFLEIGGGYGPQHRNLKTIRDELRGKNLACWCKGESPCHADVLLELANRPVCEAARSGGGK